ncbi:MAG TPA: M23 family metallopeptidase [Spirochaetota bacterium]|nr:M23 family metallopeptidase [Spirochaetota bacterium]HPJ37372.1 M23 family metallopeptidase [Spirochaetota bacterium]HPQ53747.1 M23 family metallopeptidase [Spirochaetota bacterium]
MRKFYSKTYKIGRLSLSVLVDEVILLYRTNNKVYLKKFATGWMSGIKKPLLALATVILLVIMYSAFMTNSNNSENEVVVLTDEQKKEQILQSSETDYTDPGEEPHHVEIITHVVRQGESLSRIAKKYGVSMETICGSNNLQSYELINVGMRLSIPNKEGIIYKLKRGEGLIPVVRKYKASLDKLLAVNNIRNPDFIQPNQMIFIPDAKPVNLIRGFIWPTSVRRITSGYGWRRHPIFGGRHFHKGIDVGCRYVWVRATKYGKITYTGWLGGYGRAVIISHPGGWKSLYAHLSRISVRRGQYVKQGQVVARSGNTGHSTGPHLHFELMKNGSHKNPYRLLK